MRITLTAIVLGLAFTVGFPALAETGKSGFEKYCAGCHGKEGRADTKKGKKLKAADYRQVEELQGDGALDFVKKNVRENKKHRKVSKEVSDGDLADIAVYVQKLATSGE